ncbi:hypothetical protein [Aciditerrimonas ferrireducens]|uniref:hypothetical protein n=1 Tax=Aciditerrimonas ferrireducens TaxID=667306 RepID=UPI0020049C88|nr:hypothetical protein [Aciditerrimonas ferrireducens]MCK4176414.1 hypothetical protein [Aciditerrimonas ferrireducens]
MARQDPESLVERYVRLGLELGRHLDGLVDAYYGPARLAEEAAAGPPRPLPTLVAEARRLLADLEAGAPLDGESGGSEGASEGQRRRWLLGQTTGLLTTARRLAGEPVGYVEEVEACYGVRPAPVPEDELADAHRALERLVPGSGPLAERWVAWREAHAVPPERLPRCIEALAEVLRERTAAHLGLPEGEEVHFELVQGQPWSGFNRYHGGLRSTVSINTDLPVLSLSLPMLVAHEAYPGHHTEHSRKEVRLVRGRGWWEESIFLVGTPQCLVAEGLADLGAEALLGPTYPLVVAEVLRGAGVRYDAELAVAVAEPAEVLSAARANAAWRLHVEGADADEVTEDLARFALVPRARAAKAVEFLQHPTWRAYITCYVAGLPLCRRFVAGDLRRFARLVSEQLLPADLVPPA